MKKIKWEVWEDEPEICLHTEEVEEEYDDEDEGVIEFGDFAIPQLSTPLGVFTPYDNMRPNKMFDACWVGHANFDLCSSDVQKLNRIVGVEALRIMSRYRFFVGIGKSFSFADVRKDIQESLCSSGEVFNADPHIKLKVKKPHPKINESP